MNITRTLAEFDTDQLHAEIEALDIDGFDGVATIGDQVSALFVDDISVEAAGIVEAAIDGHVPSSDMHIKLLRYVPDWPGTKLDVPLDVNYETGLTTRLHPTCSVVVDGEVRRIDYFAEATMNPATGAVTYDDLIVREDFVYQRDAVGFARGRVQTISWMRENDMPHQHVKTRVKLYEPEESLREGMRRRGNITDKLAMDLAGILMVTQAHLANPQDRLDLGRDFMRFHKTSFDMFVEASSAQILYDVRDDTEASHAVWIDDEIAPGVTIRATILDALNIWNLTL